jgi:Ribbon-helix-helix protein, copG family
MKKTSVYLSEADAAVLRRLAEDEGKSQAAVLREAIAAYDASNTPPPDRHFATDGFCEGDGSSVADMPEQELMLGFGEDDRGPYLHRAVPPG